MQSNSRIPTLAVILIGLGCCLLVSVCAACALTGVMANWANSLSLGGSGPLVGNQAPDFELLDIHGKPHRLSDYNGQPVLINFWALWCGPCKAEMPLLQQRYSELYPDLVILAIEDDSEVYNVRKYVNDSGLTFNILMGNPGVQDAYKIYGFPTSFFLDGNGTIRAIQVGGLSAADLDAALAKLGLGN